MIMINKREAKWMSAYSDVAYKKEFEKIKLKQSKLSRRKRDLICAYMLKTHGESS